MADRSSSLESSRMSADEAGVATSCEAMQLWEGWSNGSSADDASTTLSQLPELAASSRHHQPDMLSSLLSHFHPLAHPDDQSGPGGAFVFQEPAESEATVSFNGMFRSHVHLGPCDLMSQLNLHSKSPGMAPLPMWQTSVPGPESPSSPLALHKWDHGYHPPWPGATSSATIQLLQDAMADNSHSAESRSKRLELFSCTDQHRQQSFHGTDHHAARMFVPAAHNVPCSDSSHMIHNNFEAPPSHVWTSAASPEAYSALESGSRASTRSQQLTNFVRIAQEQRSVDNCSDPDNSVHTVRSYGEYPQGRSPGSKSGKQVSEAELTGPPPKRPHLQAVEHGAALWRSAHGHRSLYPPSTTSQAMEVFALGPALNTNGKPRARRGSATDPQSVYARHRREKINERLKTLQHLIPNGAKVDIVTMLDEAVHYVQFLQLQVKLLKSDKYWIHATPNSYKGIDLTCPPGTQGLGSSA